jgi:hypothetical protein
MLCCVWSRQVEGTCSVPDGGRKAEISCEILACSSYIHTVYGNNNIIIIIIIIIIIRRRRRRRRRMVKLSPCLIN